jgi:valyl-tRNA synthetase
MFSLSCQRRLTKQLRRLGNSCDWSRTAFTMGEVITLRL